MSNLLRDLKCENSLVHDLCVYNSWHICLANVSFANLQAECLLLLACVK